MQTSPQLIIQTEKGNTCRLFLLFVCLCVCACGHVCASVSVCVRAYYSTRPISSDIITATEYFCMVISLGQEPKVTVLKVTLVLTNTDSSSSRTLVGRSSCFHPTHPHFCRHVKAGKMLRSQEQFQGLQQKTTTTKNRQAY